MRIIILILFVFISCKNEDTVSTKKIIAKENKIINENKKYIQHDSEDKFKTKHWRLHGVDGALVILLHTKSIKMY